MNALKFRVWHKEEKKYYRVATIDFEHKKVDVYDRVTYITPFHSADVIIEQYTGLKDKNGKEIYEGDIVKFYEKYNGKIVYRIGSFFFEENSGRHTPLCIFNTIDCEVIGNIHMSKESVCVEWLPAFKQWRAWNKFVESWYKTFDDFLDDVKKNSLTDHYYFTSYTDDTMKKLEEHHLTKE